ncbi:MAG: HEAT repeat domain-containing protein, partial [Chloroflexi bacterium]|nr:HEAT repeat domain-containing protein [Chloroflexota bacterium]
VVVWWSVRAPSAATLINSNPAASGNVRDLSGSPNDNLVAFEQSARTLAALNSPQAFQTLVQSLHQGEPFAERNIVLTALNDAPPNVVPALMSALFDSDPSVRAGAAQVLGTRREYGAIAALSEAARDPDAWVRLEVVKTIGAIDAWQLLPRLELLAMNESDVAVRQMAMATNASFRNAIAQGIGVPLIELRDISVTAGDVPEIYAVTTSNLYALHGTAWTRVSRLPDAPVQLATGADPILIYLATVGAGLFRSLDGGETWDHVEFGLQTPTYLMTTAIAVDPENSDQLYIALASPGAEAGAPDSLGISESKDGGATWASLENSPMDFQTTHLAMDAHAPDYLFGTTINSAWRYALTAPKLTQ